MLKNKINRIIAVLFVLALIVCAAPMRADAAIVYSEVPDNAVNILADFVSQDVQNNIATDTYLLDSAQSTEYDLQYLFSSGWASTSAFPGGFKSFDIGSSGTYYGVTVDYYPSKYCMFSLDGLPALDWCTFALVYNYDFAVTSTANTPSSPVITIEFRVTCYDTDRVAIADIPIGSLQTWVTDDTTSAYFNPPDGTMYIVPYIRYIVPYTLALKTFYVNQSDYITLYQTYSLDGPDSGGGGDGGGDTEETTPTTPTTDTDLGDKLDGVQDAIDGLPDKEQHAANNQGNSSIDGVLDVVPDYSDGFVQALGALAGSMSYSGTAAVLTTPVVTMPAIPGVMSGIQLMPSYDIDFGYWVQHLPSGLLTLVQSLLTIALVGYCFKELYSTIAYLFTLRGGPAGE